MTKTTRAGKMTSAVLLTSALMGGVVFAEKPAVWWASQSGKPGAHVMLAGGGWATNGTARVLIGDKTVVPDMVSTDGLIFAWPAELGTGAADVRVVSEGETSEPFRVNRTEPWWMMGDALDRSEPGGTLRIFGRALASASCGAVADGAAPRSVADGAAPRPLVQFLAGNGKAIPLSVEKATPYDLKCRLPADVAPGTYRVVVSTPEGGAAELGAWTVGSAVKFWKDDLFNIEDFGATPSDLLDDTAAIQRALDAAGAAGGGTVLIPTGTFTCSDTLHIPPHVLVKGTGLASVLKWFDMVSPPDYLVLGKHSFGIRDLHLVSGVKINGVGIDHEWSRSTQMLTDRRICYSHDVSVRHVRFDFINDYYADRYGAAVLWRRCGVGWPMEFYGYCLQLRNVRCLDVDGITIYADRGADMLYCVSGEYVRFRNSRLIGHGGNWSIFGGDRILFEGNDLEGLTSSINPVCRRLAWIGNSHRDTWANDRETITTDGRNPMFRFAKKAKKEREPLLEGRADGTKLEIFWTPDQFERIPWVNPKPSDWEGYEVSIGAGRGVGQIRTIVKFPDEHHLEIDRPWDLPPDGTSRFSISALRMKMLFADNSFENVGTVQVYGGACNAVFAGNRMRYTTGMVARGMMYGGASMPAWYCEFVGNDFERGNADGELPSLGYCPSAHYWMSAWLTACDNKIGADARIWVGGRNMLVEGNDIRNTPLALFVHWGFPRTNLIGSNSFENVGRLYEGQKVGLAVYTDGARAAATADRERRAAEANRRGRLDDVLTARLLGIGVRAEPRAREYGQFLSGKAKDPVPVDVTLSGDRWVTPEITSVTARLRPVEGLATDGKPIVLKKEKGSWKGEGAVRPSAPWTAGTVLPLELEVAGPGWKTTVDWAAHAPRPFVIGKWQLAYLEKNALPGEKDAAPSYQPFSYKWTFDLKKDLPPPPAEAKAVLLTSYLVVTKETPVQFTKRDGFGGLWIDGKNVLTAVSPTFVCRERPVARTLKPGIHRLDYLRPLEVKSMPRVALGDLQVAWQPLVPLEPGQLRLFAMKEKAEAAKLAPGASGGVLEWKVR